ncbi:MAG TPA: gluconate 2-dehydrogenase subunit 3 family protein [Xanthobacteraceae bacterium]
MTEIARRSFVKGASLGALAFTVGGVEVMLTPRQARAQGVPFAVLKGEEAATLEALGETLAIGARQEGIAHFVDQQLTLPPPHALLSIRVSEVRPPYADFYRAALGGVDRASRALNRRGFAELTAAEQHDFVDRLRQSKIENWQGPSQSSVYGTIRNDAVDVVYGTVDGFARLGVPYMPHILPERRW